MSLNAEPSAPDVRAEHHLPPKSYADAAEEALEPESHANHDNGVRDHTEKRKWNKLEKIKANGIKIPSNDGSESLEGVGQDSSPRSPTTKGHRRVGSRSSQGSLRGRKHGEHIEHDIFAQHQNGNGDALTRIKSPDQDTVARRDGFKRRNSELKSGRQAGAGWSRSKYAE